MRGAQFVERDSSGSELSTNDKIGLWFSDVLSEDLRSEFRADWLLDCDTFQASLATQVGSSTALQ